MIRDELCAEARVGKDMEQRILEILEAHEARLTALERFAAEQGFACPYYEPDEEN